MTPTPRAAAPRRIGFRIALAFATCLVIFLLAKEANLLQRACTPAASQELNTFDIIPNAVVAGMTSDAGKTADAAGGTSSVRGAGGPGDSVNTGGARDVPSAPGTSARVSGDEKLQFLVWTYSAPVPENLRTSTSDQVICAYEECRKAFPASKAINLRELAQNSVYEDFVNHHSYQKIQLGMEFPHHIQSITILLLVRQNPGACVRTLGLPASTAICFDDLGRFASYRPEADGASPPLRPDLPVKMTKSFGVLDYEKTVKRDPGTCNVGDEMQSFGGAHFYPYVNEFVERDLDIGSAIGTVTINAWFGNKMSFPPQLHKSDPIAVAMHFQNGGIETLKANVDWFENAYNVHKGAVGARDTASLGILQNLGIRTYFSACMTLTINLGARGKRFDSGRKTVYNVDVNPKYLPEFINTQTERHLQSCGRRKEIYQFRKTRYKSAHGLVMGYAERAKVLITSRIHAALPALAQGTPVIFVDAPDLPGGGGDRTGGLVELFHRYKPGTNWIFDIDNMKPNPGVHKADRYRTAFWNTFRRRSQVYADSARFFGWVPIKRLGEGVEFGTEPLHGIFHFATSIAPSAVNWHMVRAVEYVLYHHPNARVIIHSNTLPTTGSRFEIFSEAGYKVKVQPYDLDQLSRMAHISDRPELSGAPDAWKKYTAAAAQIRESSHRARHESELLRLLALVAHGGVFLEFDHFVMKPFPRSLNSMWSVRPSGPSVMIFERDDPKLRESVLAYIGSYNKGCATCNIDRALASLGDGSSSVLFSPFDAKQITDCFETPNIKLEPAGAYAVNLDADKALKYTSTLAMTACDSLLHRHCILCDEVRTTYASPFETVPGGFPA